MRADAVLDATRGEQAPRPGRFLPDLATITARAFRQVSREPGVIIPSVIFPSFIYLVFVGSLSHVAQRPVGTNYAAFELPVAMLFPASGVSRAPTLVLDVAGGYFDRLLVTPANRLALVLGLMAADFALVVALAVPVLLLGTALGVRFATGVAGMAVFVLLAAAWGLAYTALPYAVALRTGKPSAVAASFTVFFPLAFLSTTLVPRSSLSGWLAAVATINPVTYLLAGLRSLVDTGWDVAALARAVLAVGALAAVTFSFVFASLSRRVRIG